MGSEASERVTRMFLKNSSLNLSFNLCVLILATGVRTDWISRDLMVKWLLAVSPCTTLAVHFLNDTRFRLSLLAAAKHPHSLDMPSWVPDWPDTRLRPRALDYYRNEWPDNPTEHPYFCITNTECSLESSQRVGPTLVVRGLKGPLVTEFGTHFSFCSMEDARNRMRDEGLVLQAYRDGHNTIVSKRSQVENQFTVGILEGK